MLITWVGVILLVMAITATKFPLALPNCLDSCGDVKILYPFGTTEGCYLNDIVEILYIHYIYIISLTIYETRDYIRPICSYRDYAHTRYMLLLLS